MAKKAASPAQKPLNKTQLLNEMAERTGLSKKDVGTFFEQLEALIEESLSKKGPGAVTIPGLMKIVRQIKKARPAREGRDPRTGETRMFPAKPQSTVVKVRPLKKLKEMV